MPVLRLTSKLLSQIDDPPSPEADVPSQSSIGDWYGHIFTIDRRKCILFINEPTLFVCLECWMPRFYYRSIMPFFIGVLTETLWNNRFSRDETNFILGLHQDLTIGRTQNHSTVGCLNNQIRNAKRLVQWHGGYGYCDCGLVNVLLNETPMKPIGHSKGIKEMKELVGRLMK